MNTDLHSLKHSVEQWVEQASQKNLLGSAFSQRLEQFNAETPASLFDTVERPLVVGFFGGTGVGKSTLLNRLAGEDVAKTGVERPTSREVTLYLHSTVRVDHLPKEYPVGQVRTAFHNNDAHRDILWIDMPDFDSAETANRHLVTDWLPHIDTLIYVVSPERYRDDNGWRLLLQHGGKHAWIFVINHWDRGVPAQREDFRSLLTAAGLEDPMLFCTDSGPQPEEDEFASLSDFVRSLASRNTIAQLESRGVLMRVRELESVVEQGIAELGTADAFAHLKSKWSELWHKESASMLASVSWKYPLLTAKYASTESGFFTALWHKITSRGGQTNASDLPATAELPSQANADTKALFEQDQTDSISDDIHSIVHISTQMKLPSRALRSALERTTANLERRLNQTVETVRDSALQNPGTPLQRFLSRSLAILGSVLPLAALGWAGYRIVTAFYQGGSQPAQYLGSNFAINAALLVGLSWLLPFVLLRKIKPSAQRVATKAMQQGATEALQALQQDVYLAVDKVNEETQQSIAHGRSLFANTSEPVAKALSQELQRTLIQTVD